MSKLLADLPIALKQRELFGALDDFSWYVSGQRWTSVIASTGTLTVGDALGGQLAIANAATANDEDYVKETHQVYQFLQDQPLVAEVRWKCVEANVNQANLIFGFMSGVALGALQGGNAGVSTNFSGAVIFKTGSTSQWQTCSSVGAAQTISKANASDINGNPSDGAFHTLRIEVQPLTAALAEVRYFVDGLQLRPSGSFASAVMGIVDQLTFTGGLTMSVFAGIKNGSASAETLNVDYLGAYQERYATGIYH